MTEWCISRSMASAVTTASNGFSIVCPEDDGMPVIVGFDTAVPQLIADFAAALLRRESLRNIRRIIEATIWNRQDQNVRLSIVAGTVRSSE